jgi:hypothetical protein
MCWGPFSNYSRFSEAATREESAGTASLAAYATGSFSPDYEPEHSRTLRSSPRYWIASAM